MIHPRDVLLQQIKDADTESEVNAVIENWNAYRAAYPDADNDREMVGELERIAMLYQAYQIMKQQKRA